MKTIIAIVILAGSVYFGAKQGLIRGEWLGQLFGVAPTADDRAVADAVESTNKRLPRMLSPDLSFEKVTTIKKDVVFMYRFVNHDIMTLHRDLYLEKFRDAIIQEMCNSRDVRKHAFERGYAVQVQVNSRDYKSVLNTTVRPSTCS